MSADTKFLGLNISTIFTQSVAPADAAKILEGYALDGVELVIAAGGQFAAAVLEVREEILFSSLSHYCLGC